MPLVCDEFSRLNPTGVPMTIFCMELKCMQTVLVNQNSK
jgi:hypothetical protein